MGQQTAITVQAVINTSIEKAWDLWTKPEHIALAYINELNACI